MKLLVQFISCVALFGAARAAEVQVATAETTFTLTGFLETVRSQYKLPCVGAAVIVGGEVKEIGVVGVRKFGSKIPAETGDKFHLGSCGKAMSATVIARLVEEGALSWDKPIEEYFADWKDKIHPRYRGVTLQMMLCHRAGLPGNPSLAMRLKGMGAKPEQSRELRLETAKLVLAAAPASEPGTKYDYANNGYIIAAAVAEQATGKAWEELMREKLFEPLGMTTAGFGAAGDPQKIDQPWPHKSMLFVGIDPVTPGDFGCDNGPFLAPAGTLHCSLADWAKFARLHLGHVEGIVTTATLERLHSVPYGGDYGNGWGVVEREWAGGKILTHAGSNGMNYADVCLAPKKDFAVLFTTNVGNKKASQAGEEVMKELIKRYCK